MATVVEIEKILETSDSCIDLAEQMKQRKIDFSYYIFRSEAIAYLNVAKYLVKRIK